MPIVGTESLAGKINLVKKKKNKNAKMDAIYILISLKTKNKRSEYARGKYKNPSEEEKGSICLKTIQKSF